MPAATYRSEGPSLVRTWASATTTSAWGWAVAASVGAVLAPREGGIADGGTGAGTAAPPILTAPFPAGTPAGAAGDSDGSDDESGDGSDDVGPASEGDAVGEGVGEAVAGSAPAVPGGDEGAGSAVAPAVSDGSGPAGTVPGPEGVSGGRVPGCVAGSGCSGGVTGVPGVVDGEAIASSGSGRTGVTCPAVRVAGWGELAVAGPDAASRSPLLRARAVRAAGTRMAESFRGSVRQFGSVLTIGFHPTRGTQATPSRRQEAGGSCGGPARARQERAT